MDAYVIVTDRSNAHLGGIMVAFNATEQQSVSADMSLENPAHKMPSEIPTSQYGQDEANNLASLVQVRFRNPGDWTKKPE